MKKVLFTAVVMIAFTSVSMANNIADENKIIKKIEKKTKKSTILKKRATDCCIIYDLAFQLATSEGAPPSTAEAAANLAYNNCQSSNRPTISN